MELNHESFEDLVGAYALDACEPDEAAAIEEYIATNDEAFAETERLRAAAAWLGAGGPLVPPPGLRFTLLTRAGAVVPASGADAYGALTEGFEAEVAAFPRDATHTRTQNGLDVRELVAHLDAIDRTFLNELRAPTSRAFIDAAAVVEITGEALEQATDSSFDEIVAHWDATRRDLLDAAASATDGRTVMGYGVDDALVIRAFETFTHLDDLRRIQGLPGFVPDASVLRSLADLSMRVVPYALAVTGRAHPGQSARIVLSGPGGRSWDVPLAPGEHPSGDPDVTMTVDMLEWCHRFSDRIDAELVAMEVEGDAAVAFDVVAAAPAFTGL
ncbi:MAG: domain containing protein [Actinomycetia bacterium]|nr:domain containing protein [Actinomycetes bacterium]